MLCQNVMAKRSQICPSICHQCKGQTRITPNIKQKLSPILGHHGETHWVLPLTYAHVKIICQADGRHHPCLVKGPWPTCDVLVYSPVFLHEQTWVELNCKERPLQSNHLSNK